MTGFRYRFAYDIEDQDATTAQVRSEAREQFALDASGRNIRLTGDIDVTIDGEQVVCEADAEPMPGRRVTAADRHGLRIAEMAAQGLSDPQIAAELGDISEKTVYEVRHRLGIRGGRPYTRRKAA